TALIIKIFMNIGAGVNNGQCVQSEQFAPGCPWLGKETVDMLVFNGIAHPGGQRQFTGNMVIELAENSPGLVILSHLVKAACPSWKGMSPISGLLKRKQGMVATQRHIFKTGVDSGCCQHRLLCRTLQQCGVDNITALNSQPGLFSQSRRVGKDRQRDKVIGIFTYQCMALSVEVLLKIITANNGVNLSA